MSYDLINNNVIKPRLNACHFSQASPLLSFLLYIPVNLLKSQKLSRLFVISNIFYSKVIIVAIMKDCKKIRNNSSGYRLFTAFINDIDRYFFPRLFDRMGVYIYKIFMMANSKIEIIILLSI